MKLFKYLISSLVLILFLSCETATKETNFIIISGKVIDRDYTSLLLAKSVKDLRYNGEEIQISETGEFTYKWPKPEIMEEYQMVFTDELNNSVWRPIHFYPDKDSIFFELYPMNEFEKNSIYAGPLTKSTETFITNLSNRFEEKYMTLSSKMDSIQQVDPNSPEITNIEKSFNSLNREVIDWQLNYFKDNPNIASYAEFFKLVQQRESYEIPKQRLKELISVFKTKFPDHPYTQLIENTFNKAKVGVQYVDFSAPDSTGTIQSISAYVQKNNLTLLDLWAPWCGPCIKKSREVLVAYEELSKKGFDVIAVIGGIQREEQYTKALKKHKYPWPVLMEIQDEFNIWDNYNISNSGGGQFLIDRSGKILSVNPSVEEIKEFLKGY